jgi:hypothetical protein
MEHRYTKEIVFWLFRVLLDVWHILSALKMTIVLNGGSLYNCRKGST